MRSAVSAQAAAGGGRPACGAHRARRSRGRATAEGVDQRPPDAYNLRRGSLSPRDLYALGYADARAHVHARVHGEVGGKGAQSVAADVARDRETQVAKGGAVVVGEIEEMEYGRFGWFIDPEGNKVELWEPAR